MTWADALLAEREDERRSAERGARERIARAVGELMVIRGGHAVVGTVIDERARLILEEEPDLTYPQRVRRAILSLLIDAPDGPGKLTPIDLGLARKRITVEWGRASFGIDVGWREDPND